MKEFLQKSYILFIITIVSAVGLCALSYLTVLDYSFKNEEQFITVSNDGVIDEIETSLRYGKKLSNYYGINQVLEKAAEHLPAGAILSIENENKQVIAVSNESKHLVIPLSEYGEVSQEIHDAQGGVAGVLTTYYVKKEVRAQLSRSVKNSVIGCVLIIAVLFLLTVLCGMKWKLGPERVAAALTIGIILQGAFLTWNYAGEFELAAQRSVKSVAAHVSASINRLLDKGIKLEEISDLDVYLEKAKEDNSFIEDIYVGSLSNVKNGSAAYVEEIGDKGDEVVLEYHISQGYIRQNVMNMVLTFLATIILAIIVMKESMTLSDMISFRGSEGFNKPTDEQFDVIAKAIRYGNFLALTFDYMCLSFSALQIKEWNEGFMGMPPTMAAALSISICSIADLLGMIAMPSIGRHIKGRYLMAISAVVVVVSNISCFLTRSVAMMICMRFFAGVGTAGIKQVRNIVIAQGYSNENQRNANLAASNNGVIGGLLCGMGLGGVVAGVFGYQTTFLVAGIGHILYLIFEAFCVPWDLLSTREAGTLSEESGENLFVRMASAFRSIYVWRTVFLVVVPQYFLLMLIVCLIPGRIQSLGLPGVVLTYANLLNGVIGLYVGERLYRLMQKMLKNDVRIEMAMLITGAVTMFIMDIPVYQSVIILVAASLAGIIDGVGSPVSADIFMGNAALITYLNDTEILMVYSVIGSAIMAVAPFLLELCEKNVAWMYGTGVALIAAAALIPFVRNMPKRKKASD